MFLYEKHFKRLTKKLKISEKSNEEFSKENQKLLEEKKEFQMRITDLEYENDRSRSTDEGTLDDSENSKVLELQNQNKKLRAELEEIKEELWRTRDSVTTFVKIKDESAENENRQLKKDMAELKETIKQLRAELTLRQKLKVVKYDEI